MNKLIRPMAQALKMTATQTLMRNQMVLNQTRMLSLLSRPQRVNSLFVSNSRFAFSTNEHNVKTLYLQDLSDTVDEEMLR